MVSPEAKMKPADLERMKLLLALLRQMSPYYDQLLDDLEESKNIHMLSIGVAGWHTNACANSSWALPLSAGAYGTLLSRGAGTSTQLNLWPDQAYRNRVPLTAVFAHELVHVWQMDRGVLDRTKPKSQNWIRAEDAAVRGENMIRRLYREKGTRPNYGVFPPTY